jgi:subtilase family serine protease
VIRKLGMALFALAAVAAVNIVCQAESQTLLTRHVREAVLNGEARVVGRLPATQTMHFDIVMGLRHHPELENFLQELYDPSSPFYHQYVTVPEFTARFGPSQEDYDALLAFAGANGFTMVGGSRDAFDVRFTAPVAAIEKAFHVTMGVFQHPTEDRTFYAMDREPTADLPFQLWHISGLDNYSIPRPLLAHRDFKVKSDATTGSCPDKSFCGSDMRAAYYEGTALTGAGQNIGLLEFAGFDIADVNTYYKNAGQKRTAAVTGIAPDGSSLSCLAADGCDDTEQTIDITQALGMAPGVTTVYLYVSTDSDTAIFSAMSTDTPLPLSLSSSWTYTPVDPGAADPYFEKMAAQGQTFFQASGDDGSYEGTSPWPTNSAFVVAVGGTDLVTQSAGGPWKSETAWTDGGGGWGTNIAIPSWQQLAGVITTANGGSTKFRNVPDVAANANYTFYVCADQTTCTANDYGGTSFAAPMWAGYLALTNQQAAADGDPAPGFIDPTIYPLNLANGDADFHQITSGSNGFKCTAGYNLCTGWGSPNGSLVINALTAPTASFTLSASPGSLTVTRDSSGTSKITITPVDGFSGNVTLAATGLPKGVTASFSPNPATSSSTLTLTASNTAKLGAATVTITGTSGSLTASTTVTLTVDALGNFTLTSAPKTLTLVQGSSGTSTITVVPTGGFDQEVTLAATGMPTGVTASFSKNPTTSTSTLTLKVSGSAAAGKSTITITGTFGALSKKTTIKLTVDAS